MRRALCLLALLTAACAPSEPVSQGRAYYAASSCRNCHRIGAEGRSAGPDLSFVGFRQSPEWLDLWLKDPKAWRPQTTMPDPRLSPTARRQIVLYLSELKGQDMKPRPWESLTEPVAKGRLIFQRAGCIACHGPAGRGGYPNSNVPGREIPVLARTARTFTKAELVAKIRLGSTPQKEDASGPAPLVRMPAWGEVLSDSELEAVAEYLLTIKPEGPVADESW